MKRGGPLRRRTPLRSKARTLRRGKRLAPVNEERLARLRAEQFGPQADLARTLPCCACGAPPPSDPAHVRSRGAGGKDADVVPLCRKHHDEQHQHGIQTFQERHGVDLADVARQLAARLAGG